MQQKNLKERFYATGANIYNVYAKCFNVTELTKDYEINQKLLNYENQEERSLKHPLRCSDSLGEVRFLNTEEYRDPLNMPGIDDIKWTPCSDVINYTIEP